MTSASKDLPWSEWSLWGTPYTINPSWMRALATVTAFWSLVGMATVNFVKTSVSTNTLSNCPMLAPAGWNPWQNFEWLSCDDAAHRSSCCQVRTFCHRKSLALGDPAFHFSMHFCHQHRRCTTCSVRSGPGYPKSLWTAFSTSLRMALGTTRSCFGWPSLLCTVFYNTPSFSAMSSR